MYKEPLFSNLLF